MEKERSYEQELEDLSAHPGYATLVWLRSFYEGEIEKYFRGRNSEEGPNFRENPSMISVCAGFHRLDRLLRKVVEEKERSGRVPRLSEFNEIDSGRAA